MPPVKGNGLLPAIISGGGALIGGAIGALSKKKQNEASRKWELEQWNRQNAYNHPQAQMQRLQEAKLNPNLIYGSSANTGNASPIGTPQFDSISGDSVGNAGTAAVNTYYDTQVKKAQANNLERQNDVMIQDIALKNAQAQNIGTKTKQAELDLSVAKQYSADAQKAALDNAVARTNNLRTTTQQSKELHSGRLTEQAIDIVNKRTNNKYTEEQIKQAIIKSSLLEKEKALMDVGIHKGDALWTRLIVQNWDVILKNLQILSKKF